VPKGHKKQFGCWQWQSGKIIFSYVDDNQQRVTIEETFDDTWLDFTTAWYKEDWPHSSGY
jgi:hypothetical protein